MISDQKVLSLIPARYGSKGLPLKNIKPLAGIPLLAWPINAALGSNYIDRVVISTDSQEFADIAISYGAEAPFLRPEHLASDKSSSMDFILHAIEFFENQGELFDYVVLLEPTSPLTESIDIDNAVNVLFSNREVADSILGVTLLETTHPAFTVSIESDGLIKPFMSATFEDLPRRQDLQPLYSLDGSLYISSTKALKERKSFCHDRTLPFITSKYKSFEVDDLIDFVCIEAMVERLEEINSVQL